MLFIKYTKLTRYRLFPVLVLPYHRNELIKVILSCITYNLVFIIRSIIRISFGCSIDYKLSQLFPLSINHFLRMFNINYAIFKIKDYKFLVRTWVYDDEATVFLRVEEDILSLINLNKDSIVIDIGAYIGTYSIRFCKIAYKGKIVSIEPLYDNYLMLVYNAKLNNCKNLYSVNMGIWSEEGTKSIFYKSDRMTLATLNINLIDKQSNFHKNLIKVTTLDKLINSLGLTKIDFIKIDVEGSEYEVLMGANKALDITRSVLIETHENNRYKCIDYLKNKGFKIIDLGIRHRITRYFFAKK
ncbi:MAG: FkbM family methyltransferase [Thermoproteota archaeon]|nr:FkbM family methyltransferase [Thermoproteota archaeon]